jgi:phosphohistidine swiveling domain-containing protein
MSVEHFDSRAEVIKAIGGIAKLFSSWGLRSDDWMIGKYLSLYLSGVIKSPRSVTRDINLYVLRNSLPWKSDPKARLTFPSKKSTWGKAYYNLQKRWRVGLDLMVIPDHNLKNGFINKNVFKVSIGKKDVNVESLEKFIYRLNHLSELMRSMPVRDFREYYFADKTRYAERLKFYNQVKKGASKDLKPKIDKIIKDYKFLIKRAYPELFGGRIKEQTVLHGTVGYNPNNLIIDRAVHFSNKLKLDRGQKRVFLFSHFLPAHANILPYARAIITEGGGNLSHAAIVCRELKIPCLVGVRGLLTSIPNGANIEVNLNKGIVRLLA